MEGMGRYWGREFRSMRGKVPQSPPLLLPPPLPPPLPPLPPLAGGVLERLAAVAFATREPHKAEREGVVMLARAPPGSTQLMIAGDAPRNTLKLLG